MRCGEVKANVKRRRMRRFEAAAAAALEGEEMRRNPKLD